MKAEKVLKKHVCLEWLKEDYPNNWKCILDAMKEYASKKTKKMYSREFVEWLKHKIEYNSFAFPSSRYESVDEAYKIWLITKKNSKE